MEVVLDGFVLQSKAGQAGGTSKHMVPVCPSAAGIMPGRRCQSHLQATHILTLIQQSPPCHLGSHQASLF